MDSVYRPTFFVGRVDGKLNGENISPPVYIM